MGPHAAAAAVAGAVAGAVIPPPPGILGAAAPVLPFGAPAAAVVDGGLGLGFQVPDRGEAQQMAATVLELRAALSELSVQKGGKEKEKDKKERREGEKKRKKRKKKRTDSSSSGRSRSTSSSSGDREPNTKFPQWAGPWKEKQSRKEITTAMATRALGFRPKQTRALYALAQRHPGALGALFLMQVRQEAFGGPPARVSELYGVDPTSWAAYMTDLREIWGLRGGQCLSNLVKELNDRVPEAVYIAQRNKVSWDQAARVSRPPSGSASTSAPMPAGALDP